MKVSTVKAYVDSIYGDSARVLIGDEGVAVAVPLRLLPPRTLVGMVLRVRFTLDQAATLARGASAKSMGFDVK